MTANTKRVIASLIAGIVFGVGLAVSGLANPDNVLQFLTLSANWSPALLFTMGAGVLVTYVGYRWVLQRGPVLVDELQMPTSTSLDRRLLVGSGIFGIGWGLAGFCPGPAIAGLSSGRVEPFVFIAAMLVGSQIQRLMSQRLVSQ